MTTRAKIKTAATLPIFRASSHKVKTSAAARVKVRNKEALVYLIELSYLCSSYALWAIVYKLNRPKCRIYSIIALGVGSISESTPMTHREIRPLRIKSSNAPEEPETSSTNPELQKIVIPTTANTVIICGC